MYKKTTIFLFTHVVTSHSLLRMSTAQQSDHTLYFYNVIFLRDDIKTHTQTHKLDVKKRMEKIKSSGEFGSRYASDLVCFSFPSHRLSAPNYFCVLFSFASICQRHMVFATVPKHSLF